VAPRIPSGGGRKRKEDEALREEEINHLKHKIAELTMDLDILLLD